MRTKLIHNLVANSQPPTEEEAAEAMGAGGLTFMALRLFAFWLSWVRFHVVKDYGAMMLSQRLLDALQVWGGEGASEQEKELRKNLFEDFSRFGVAEDEGPWGHGVSTTGECSLGVKEKGNEAFKAGRNLVAVSHYSMAMDLHPSEASLYANRAAALLKWASGSGLKPEERELHLSQVVVDCTKAVEFKPDYPKAHFRKAQALVELKQWSNALSAVDVGLVACPGEETLLTQRKELIEAMPEMHRPAQEEEEEEEEGEEEEGEDLLDVE